MFDLSFMGGMSGLSGFMGGMSSLGWTPPSVPVGAFGDMMNLNSVFNTTLGPSGLVGMGGAPLSISAGFSGAVGGDAALWQNAMVPTYGITMERTPVYNYESYAWDNQDQSGQCDPVFVCDANDDGEITTDDLVATDETDCPPEEYHDGWENIRERLGTEESGMIEGEQLSGVKIWFDDNEDGEIGTDELRLPETYGIVGIDTDNGELIRKNLLGYQCTPRQTVTGYYNLNNYTSNTGIGNMSFTWEPMTAGSALEQSLMGGGSFGSLAGVPNFYGQPNAWGSSGYDGGTGWSSAWAGSGWGNGYAA